jgi:hypothetical protein
MADGDGHYEAAEMLPCRRGEVLSQGFEKASSFPWDSTDGKHAAVPLIRYCYHNPYRLNTPHFFCPYHHPNPVNRSV